MSRAVCQKRLEENKRENVPGAALTFLTDHKTECLAFHKSFFWGFVLRAEGEGGLLDSCVVCKYLSKCQLGHGQLV